MEPARPVPDRPACASAPTLSRRLRIRLPLGLAAALAGCATVSAPAGAPSATSPAQPPDPRRLTPDPAELAQAMRAHTIVLLGENHDNAVHHRLRLEALAHRVAAGARPAIAFEQFDRERQVDIDRIRRARPRDTDALIEQAGQRGGWDWALYRPFVALALEHDLPIIAANLSRADAGRVVREGFAAVFDASTRAALGLDAIDPTLMAAHEAEVDHGHCGLMPAAMLAPMARAQIARDAVLATTVAAHASRGVVLLTGNGHARRDLGVVRWLPVGLRDQTLAVGLLEPSALATMPAHAFDAVIATPAPQREDPCAALRARMRPPAVAPKAPAPQGR